MAGGKGTRLKPYTVALPKPLMPVGEYPILEIIIRQLKNCGFSRIILAVNHQADLIKAYFQDGERWGIQINYSLERTALGTIAPLLLLENLPANFIVMNGDILTDLRFDHLYEEHLEKNSLFTISAACRIQNIDFGVLSINDLGILDGFLEKPSEEYFVSMGIYVVSRRILDLIPTQQPFGFDNLMQMMLERSEIVNVRKHPGYWLDIGRPDDYIEASDTFDSIKSKLNIE